jgi:hypothetical protein
MHPLEIREKRFKLQKALEGLEDGPEKAAIEAQIEEIRATCPHEHTEEDEEKGWRCRDCDLLKPPPPKPAESEETAAAVESDEPAPASA